jgi:Delta7-sterol 5-desaturase
MVSFKSIVNFASVNIVLTSIGITQYILLEKQSLINNHLLLIFLVFVIRNYGLMALIDYGVKHKPTIQNHLQVMESYKHEFNLNVMTSTLVETFTYAFIRSYIFETYSVLNIGDIMLFIPYSFLFELIFDLFHYWSHRIVHHKLLYKHLHKKHHKFLHPTTIITYYQDPVDLLITNSIPTLLTLLIMSFISLSQFNIMLIYKEFIEISGHCGRNMFPTNSFSQCIWLPRLFNIQLYSEEHDLHHSVSKCNYSKRFTIWDKVFGTYLPFSYQESK